MTIIYALAIFGAVSLIVDIACIITLFIFAQNAPPEPLVNFNRGEIDAAMDKGKDTQVY